jgi:NB-ARC domain
MARQPGYKASPDGLRQIHNELRKRGLFVDLCIGDTTRRVSKEFDITQDVARNFITGRKGAKREIFESLCQKLGLDPEEIRATRQLPIQSDEPFYGRTEELNKLKDWVESGICRTITVHGFDGMGKSSLVRELIKVRKQENESFPEVIWETFSYGKPVDSLLSRLLRHLKLHNSSGDLDLERQFRDRLTQKRYLIVLEQIPDNQTDEYDDHKRWLRELLKYRGGYHASCILLITSSERPDGMTDEANDKVVKRLPLRGVDPDTGLDILKNREPNLAINPAAAAELVRLFDGYPSALKCVARLVQDHYEGNVREFLDNPSIPKKIEKTIMSLVNDLSEPARIILHILNDYSEPISRARLRELYMNVEQITDASGFTDAIDSLLNRSLIIKDERSTEYDKNTDFFDLDKVAKRVICRYSFINM